MIADTLISLGLGVMLGLLGRWGRRHAAVLVPTTVPEPDRQRRERVLHRGAVMCQCLAVVFVVTGLLRVWL